MKYPVLFRLGPYLKLTFFLIVSLLNERDRNVIDQRVKRWLTAEAGCNVEAW